MLKPIFYNPLWICGVLLTLGAIVACTTNRNPNVKVQFVNPKDGWIVGAQLLSTTDGGRTWNIIRDKGFGTFEAESIGYGHRSIQFIDSSTGVQLGGNVLAKTHDGGRTWTEQVSIPKSLEQNIPPQSVFFLSSEVGWVVGENIYHTTNGGRSWLSLSKTPLGNHQRQRQMRIAPSHADYMPALWFTDAGTGLMARLDGEVYYTNDGGKTWELIWSVDKKITDVFFISDHEGWIVGDEGFIARTNDGGRTWVTVSIQTKADFTSIFFLNAQLGWVTGLNSTILYTRDGGRTWQRSSIANLKGSPPLASVSFADSLHGYAVGGNSDPMYPSAWSPSNVILFTGDGGQTWRPIRP